MNMCKFTPDKQCNCGVFARKNWRNPYKDWTLLHVTYCSGDAHAGATKRSWTVPKFPGAKVVQKGYENAASAIDWAKENIRTVKSLVIMGCSAGSLGAQMWTSKILREFTYESASVVADSYAGVFPQGVQGQQFKSAGVCNTPILPDKLKSRCYSGRITLQEIFLSAMREFPNVAFVSLNGKTDTVQKAFYEAIHLSFKHYPVPVTDAGFYEKLQRVESYYARQHNFLVYDVNAANHCYLNTPYTFTTTCVGAKGQPTAANNLLDWSPRRRYKAPLTKWLRGIPVKAGKSIKSQCSGHPGLPGTFQTNFNGFEYCQAKAMWRRFKARPGLHQGQSS